MTIQEAYYLFENLITKTSNKSEIKIYQDFMNILSKLKKREFSKDEIQSIEMGLENLKLKSQLTHNKKYYVKALNQFKEFLKESHSLVTVGHHTSIGVSMGAAFGVVAGVVFGERFEKSLGLALGISLGMLIGAFIGRQLDTKALAQGKVLS